MSRIKFTYNKVYNYVKGKPVVELVFEGIAFGILLPLVVIGITALTYHLVTNGISDNLTFGIYG